MQWLNLEDNVNLLALIGAALIIVLTIVVAGRYVGQMKVKKDESVELSEHNWDGIGEYKNPVPLGWAVVFLLVLVWAIWYYLLGYPLNSYSQIGEYNKEVKEANAKFEKEYANPSKETLHAMGESIYLVQCSACHGITGDGIGGKAANLQIWGSEKGIVETILNGSKGLDYPMGEMPAGLADAEGAKAIAAYVAKEISAIKSTKNENLVATGKDVSIFIFHYSPFDSDMTYSPTALCWISFSLPSLNLGIVPIAPFLPRFSTSATKLAEPYLLRSTDIPSMPLPSSP